MSQPLRLYGLHTSRCTQIARFTLNEKKVPFQYVRVNVRKGEGKSPEHLARHPLGKIPVLEVQEKYYFESIAISRYVDAISTPSLVPADPVAALAVNQWVSSFIYNFYPYAYIIKTASQRGANDTTSVADNIASAKTHLAPILAAYEKQLANGGYLAGSEFSLADIVHMPYLNVLVTAVPELIQGRMWDQAQLGTTAPMAYNSQQAGPADGVSNSILWMGDLEPWMDENYIRQLWMSMGEVVNVKMIRDKISNSNAGYCFVDFMNPAGAAKHLASINGTTIPGTTRVFKLNWASGGGAAGIMSGGPGMERGPEYSLFVGDLGPDVTDYMLLQAFLPRYLTCKSAKVVTDPATSMSRGYGFVRFSDESEQQRALAEMQGQFCGSRAMRLSLATPKANPGTGIPPTSPNGGAPFAPPPQPAAAPVPPQGYYPPAPVAPQMPSAGGYNQFSDPTNTTIFVGGLNTQISDEELRSYFLPFGEVVYTKIPPGKGCGFVQFVHRQSAEMALAQMNGFLIGGSRVRLSWGRSQAIPKTDYRPVSAGPYGAPSPYSAGGYPHPAGYAQGYAPAPHYPMHPQQPPVQPAPMLRDPRDPVTAERANREFLERRQRVAMEGGIGAGWRAYGV